MLGELRTVVLLGIAAALAGCAAIKGVSNTNLYTELPRNGTFAVRLMSGDPVVGNKIERMLRYKLERLGYRFTEASPDFLVSFTYDTVPGGVEPSAFYESSQAGSSNYSEIPFIR